MSRTIGNSVARRMFRPNAAQFPRAAGRYGFDQKCINEWLEFGQQPGTNLRLSWARVGSSRSSRDCAGHFAAQPASGRAQAEASGRKPGIAQRLTEVISGAPIRLGQLADEAGMPILYTSGRNFRFRACAGISFPDQRWLRFFVRGTRKTNAIMTAVDQAGNKVARYRITGFGYMLGREKVEITVHPDRDLTDELVLAIAISAPWLSRYFDMPVGG